MYIYSRAKDNRVVCTTYDIICVFDLKEKIAMFALFFCRKICADERRLRQGTPAKFSAHSHGFTYIHKHIHMASWKIYKHRSKYV